MALACARISRSCRENRWDGELAVLLDRYERIRGGGGPQLVTLVGSAGIGKSRLLAELGRRVVGEPAPPAWRTCRAQPNVDGGTFGALVEVAKAEAGILDGDSSAGDSDGQGHVR